MILILGVMSSTAVLVIVREVVLPSVGVTVPLVFLPVELEEMEERSDLSSLPMALRKRSLSAILYCVLEVAVWW